MLSFLVVAIPSAAMSVDEWAALDEDVRDPVAGRWISEPLCLYDNCLETDGAVACVIVPADRARDIRRRKTWSGLANRAVPSFARSELTEPTLQRPAWVLSAGVPNSSFTC